MSSNPPSQDILKRFPYEIWSECILNAIYQAPEGPLPFLGVSSYWQTTLLGSPEMWSYIHVDDGEDVHARVDTFLVLSGCYPLEVAAAFTKPVWLRVKPAISAHKERIKLIHVLTWPEILTEDEKIQMLLEDITSPALRTITTSQRNFNSSTFEHILDICPNLDYSAITVIDRGSKDNKGVPQRLRAARIAFATTSVEVLSSQVQPYLHLKNLEHFVLTTQLPPGSISEAVPPNSFALSSSKLQDLVLTTSMRPVLQGILGSPLRHLSFLGITTPPSQFDILISTFPSLPVLRVVYLGVLFENTNPGKFSRLHRSHIPNVRRFKINIRTGPPTSLNAIFDALTDHDALAGIDEFAFTCDYQGESVCSINVAKLFYSLRNCTFLGVSSLQDAGMTAEMHNGIVSPIYMPNLLRLDITDSIPIPPITAPSLRSLEISSQYLSNTNYPLNHFGRALEKSDITGEVLGNSELSPFNHWETVQHIHWGSCKDFIGQKTINFQYLQSVDFFAFSLQGYDQMHALNTFLVALLRYPDSCPQLRSIKTLMQPMWQLFSQVLLQRNGNGSLDRLQDIWLPCLPIRPLLVLVVALLNGEQNPIPYYVDYMILCRFKHKAITSCSHCIKAGYTQCPDSSNSSESDPANQWWQQKEDGSMHDIRNDTDYLELLELPLDTSSIPATDADLNLSWKEWQDRLRQMTDDCKDTSREWSCDNRSKKLVRIHKYMLHD